MKYVYALMISNEHMDALHTPQWSMKSGFHGEKRHAAECKPSNIENVAHDGDDGAEAE